MPTNLQHEKARDEYTSQIRSLFILPETASKTEATRGGEDIPFELLAERTEKLIDISEQLGSTTADYLVDSDRGKRESAEMKLLAQATAELNIARELLELADEADKEKSAAVTTRSARAAGIQQSLNELANVLETPIEDGMKPFLKGAIRREGKAPEDLKEAKSKLQKDAKSSLNQITKKASKVGGRAVRDLLLLDGAVLAEGAKLVGKDLTGKLDKLYSGLGAIARRLASSAIRLIYQAYEWIRSLLGKEIDKKAHDQVIKWLGDLKKEPKEDEDPFGDLVNKIYSQEKINDEVSEWLKTSGESIEKMNHADEAVLVLPEKFQAKMDQAENLLKLIALAKLVPMINIPQGQLVIAAVTLGLLGYVLYSGYDHVDSGNVTFLSLYGFKIPDRVEGVRETVLKSLDCPTEK